MEDKPINPEESLQIIHGMIEKTKQNIVYRSSDYLLLWGWLVLIACLAQYFLLTVIHYRYHYYAWHLMWLGAIGSVYLFLRDRKVRPVRTYIDESVSSLWIGIILMYFSLGFILAYLNYWEHGFAFYMLLYALGTFVTGRIIRFRPLVYGAFVCFIFAWLSLFLSYENQILLNAAAIIASYLIPAYLLKNKMRTAHETA
jgi:hypothetical protein